MKHFIEWDNLEVRVDGKRLNEMVKAIVGKQEPIERIDLEFHNGLLRVVGAIRKFITVPFSVDITELRASGTTVRVPLQNASAAGFPLPNILFGLLQSRLPKELVGFEPPATLVLSLDRFLPPFIEAEVQQIWIKEGGMVVTLGRGGADLPRPEGQIHERNDQSG